MLYVRVDARDISFYGVKGADLHQNGCALEARIGRGSIFPAEAAGSIS